MAQMSLLERICKMHLSQFLRFLVFIVYVSSEGLGESFHLHSLASEPLVLPHTEGHTVKPV